MHDELALTEGSVGQPVANAGVPTGALAGALVTAYLPSGFMQVASADHLLHRVVLNVAGTVVPALWLRRE